MNLVRISDISVPPGRRPLRDIKALASSMEEIGLLNPITVTEDKTLVAGLHRLEAAKSLSWREIECTVIDLDELGAALAEIDENLIRNELTELEKADLLKRRKELTEALHPETKRGVAGAHASNKAQGKEHATVVSTVASFVKDTAAKTGLSESTIRQSVQIAASIPEEVKEDLRGTPVADRKTDLLDLSRRTPEAQRSIVKEIKAGVAKTVKEACKAAGIEPLPSPKKAREQAIASGHPVAASNNRVILPMPEEEERALSEKMHRISRFEEAVNTLAEWSESAEQTDAMARRFYKAKLWSVVERAASTINRLIGERDERKEATA